MEIYILIGALFLQLVIIVMLNRQLSDQRKAFQAERADMLDRLMSRTFAEYKEQTATPEHYSGPVDVNEEEEYEREIESMKSGTG